MKWHRIQTLALGMLVAFSGQAGIAAAQPDPANSFYVPQAGPYGPFALEGEAAIVYFRACPNNDGDGSLPLDARIKVVLRNSSGGPLIGVPKEDIFVLFNGGTAAQGFPLTSPPACDPAFQVSTLAGADSIVGNCVFNTTPNCPMTTRLMADSDTDSNGETTITFGGFGVRDPNRKWGHYDAELPVYAQSVQITGRLSSTTTVPYDLRIKNYDWAGGLGALLNLGETVTSADFNGVANGLFVDNALSYWRDFDSSGAVGMEDFNMIVYHVSHDCDSPNNP